MASTLIQPHFDTAALATGVRLRYHEQGDAAGDVLVLVHGWPDSWYSYSRMLAHLPRRYHAYAVDLRGFGGSDRPATVVTTRAPPSRSARGAGHVRLGTAGRCPIRPRPAPTAALTASSC